MAKKKTKIKDSISKRKATRGSVTVKGLYESSANYNPRTITERELSNLKKSYETYGDLSGIVLNKHTNTLISGHQRIKTLQGKKTKIDTHAHKDAYGTIAVGNILVRESDGSITKIPYREVKWKDAKAEMAANIAANAGGGQFDNDKLGSMLEELDMDDSFMVETLGLDPLSIKQLTQLSSVTPNPKSGNSSTQGESSGGFKEYGEDSFDLEHECPKCKYKWS